MSILTKEGIQKILNDDWLLMDDCEGLENCTVIKELARMALAAMDSEPVVPVVPDALPWEYLRGWPFTYSDYAKGWNACRAAMLQASPVCTCPSGDGSLRWPCPVHPGNSPIIGIDLASVQDRTVEVRYVAPPGYVMVPMRLTAENGAKGALSGEFSETKFVNCPECFGDDECETCDGSGRIEITVPVTWSAIKDIWAKGVEHFAAAPQEVR
ncbi:hypothetical protein [Klebsiella pneumoniae]|uniref:hypothetical protein n=1 Tax=Klebsiella pneumoniae TaxID=573 RepID=UPI001D0EF69D|nr:hypothetical protein [Klebsiella pneumoniae]